jgi:hypothetical protein
MRARILQRSSPNIQGYCCHHTFFLFNELLTFLRWELGSYREAPQISRDTAATRSSAHRAILQEELDLVFSNKIIRGPEQTKIMLLLVLGCDAATEKRKWKLGEMPGSYFCPLWIGDGEVVVELNVFIANLLNVREGQRGRGIPARPPPPSVTKKRNCPVTFRQALCQLSRL